LVAQSPELDRQVVRDSQQLPDLDDGWVIHPHPTKTLLIGADRVSEDVGVQLIVLGAGNRMAIPKSGPAVWD
jgi:hypothetical protein